MATRSELKRRAKDCLRRYYWMAFLVCLVASILGGGAGSSSTSIVSGGFSGFRSAGGAVFDSLNEGDWDEEYEDDYGSQAIAEGENLAQDALFPLIAVVLLGFGLVVWALAVAWGIFLGNPIQVGCCRYFMESRETKTSAGFGRLFWCFGRGKYLNVVKVMFLRGLFVFLWTLLLIVPGIIKTYEYRMVPYILSENPEMNYRDALDLSREMMDGYKFRFFLFELSFLGWYILGTILCGIGILFVIPYETAATAEWYAEARTRHMGGDLPGYGKDGQEPYADYTVIG